MKISKKERVTLVPADVGVRVIISRGFRLTTTLPGRTILRDVAFCDMRNALNRLHALPSLMQTDRRPVSLRPISIEPL